MTMTTFTKTVLSVGLSAALLAIALVAVPPAQRLARSRQRPFPAT